MWPGGSLPEAATSSSTREILNPKPETRRNPKPKTQNPKPKTQNPKAFGTGERAEALGFHGGEARRLWLRCHPYMQGMQGWPEG
jgi:hypothetical protein